METLTAQTSRHEELLAAALNYATIGWHVIPLYNPNDKGICNCQAGPNCDKPGKHPRVKDWPNQATTNEQMIRSWWAQWPLANIGIHCENLLLLDIDGEAGKASVKNREMPTTPMSTTGRGYHVVFKAPDGIQIKTKNTVGTLPGCDIRTKGGQFVAPPSLHYSGDKYLWAKNPFNTPLADAPGWLIETFKDEEKPARPNSSFNLGDKSKAYGQKALADEIAKIHSAQNGTRNDTLNHAAFSLGQLVGGWELDEWEVENELLSAAISIGLKPTEAKSTIKSGLAAGKQEPRTAPKSKEFQEAKAEKVNPEIDPATGEIKDDLFLADFSADDDGNAEAFRAIYGQTFLFCKAYGWLWWCGTHWKMDLAEQNLFEKMTEVLKRRRVAGVQAEKEAVIKCSKPNSSTINNAISLLEKKLEVLVEAFDRLPNHVNCQNGVLNLLNGELDQHDPQQRFTYCIPIAYDSTAQSEAWDNFIKGVVGGGQDVLDYLQQALGYTLTGQTNEECLFYLYGPTRSGKGTLTEIIMSLMGRPLAAEADFNTFTARRDGDSNNFDLAPLKPARAVFASESERYQRLNPAKIKQLTGGNYVYCSFKHRDHFNYRPQYKLWLSSNWPVNGDVDDDALWGRVRVLDFPNSFLGREDKLLKLKLKQPENLRAAFAWMVQGAIKWYHAPNGLETPAEVTRATFRQREEADAVQTWLDENCEQDLTAWESNADVYSNYERWCKSNGVEAKQMRNLSASLKTKGYSIGVVNRRHGATARGITGLRIIPRI